ncbi:LytTR family DNA-binding domain-containing protein [Telluribacter sp.]|jgi:DNA-binding LytR/AlgR family response regulator|uniref:LytR/AlgR family response regulator transcription factor n=1 Tax=Telluribacter sp. TaxID=1978767 RepID=UPI002E12C551|nr:LytTR family DNA-binding domain-containing protein [Telluribacter sp.]
MTYTCVIVEDEPLARSLLEQYVAKVPYLHLVNSFSNPMAALEFLRNQAVDILFSDIQMPEITGITLLKILQKKPLVILTTAYSEYALEGYELDVADYLLKPISFERFLKSVEKVSQRLASSQPTDPAEKPGGAKVPEATQSFIFVKDGTRLVKVRLDEITYIEGLKDYVALHTRHKKIVTLQTMKSLETQLPVNRFIRIHNSYIVAFEAIETIDREKVQIGLVYLPISDTYRKSFREFIERNQIGE